LASKEQHDITIYLERLSAGASMVSASLRLKQMLLNMKLTLAEEEVLVEWAKVMG
jgi:hypothetical protein